MKPDRAVSRLADRAGILRTYRDIAGNAHPTLRETKLAMLRACGWQLDNDAMLVEAVKQDDAARQKRILKEEIVVRSGAPLQLTTPTPVNWSLMLENTRGVFAEGYSGETINLPSLDSGVHKLHLNRGNETQIVRLIAAPVKAPSVLDVTGKSKLWGINLALYGLHSDRNPSIGDFEDLAQVSATLAENGAGFCGINPVHATGWSNPEVISPYSPTHRGFLNTNHIALDQIEPASDATSALIADWKGSLRNSSSNTVDYECHAQHHRVLLRALFNDFCALATVENRAAFDSFCEQESSILNDFINFENLSETYGSDWKYWPVELQSPPKTLPAKQHSFHAWLQWHAETQLSEAQYRARSTGMGLGLYLDLAVGARRNGAEAWMEQESVAKNVSIGAPPDHLSPAGQNWGLTAFSPKKLAATDYRAFRDILARNMRHCGVLRIDHILGLCRSFWIPDDGSPGGYIRQNLEAMLAIVRIEAERNQTVIIGEDLGLVPKGFRKRLLESGIYSYSVLQYEKTESGKFRKPSRLRAKSLACFGTHDTPTLSGFAEKRDIDWWQKLGWVNDEGAKEARLVRESDCAELKLLAPDQAASDCQGKQNSSAALNRAVHNALAASSVEMVSVQLDDIEGQVEAQNLPGTVNEHPNWQRRTTATLEQLESHPELIQTGQLMGKHGRNNLEVEQSENTN